MLRAMWAMDAQLKSSEGNNSNLARDHAWDILGENVAAFWPCPKNFPEELWYSITGRRWI